MHTPIGLPIGAETPAEIAVSIVGGADPVAGPDSRIGKKKKERLAFAPVAVIH